MFAMELQFNRFPFRLGVPDSNVCQHGRNLRTENPSRDLSDILRSDGLVCLANHDIPSTYLRNPFRQFTSVDQARQWRWRPERTEDQRSHRPAYGSDNNDRGANGE